MKPILLTAVFILSSICSSKLFAQYDKCAPSVPVVSFYYSAEAHTKFGAGFEAGVMGIESPFGLMAGFRFQEMSGNYLKTDTANFDLRGSLYLKGLWRLNEPTGKGSILLIAAPELSVQTGFDVKAGTRFVLPVGGKKTLGFEPLYSIRQRTVSFNIIASF